MTPAMYITDTTAWMTNKDHFRHTVATMAQPKFPARLKYKFVGK